MQQENVVQIATKSPKSPRGARSGLKRTSYLRRGKSALKRKIKPRKTNADFLRSWGIFPGTYIRYKGLKGVYWFWFSRTVRERDYKEHKGLCMTCLQYVEKGQDQGGHLFPASKCGFALLFHPKNVHLQHSHCNNPRITPQAGVLNAIHIDQRYGAGTVEMLAKLKGLVIKEWGAAEYRKRICELPAYKASLAAKL